MPYQSSVVRRAEPFAVVAALGAGLAFAGAAAQTAGVDDELATVERALDAELGREQALELTAAQLEREVAGLRLELVEAARHSQDHEERVTALEERLTELTRLEAEKSAALRRRRETLAATLGALQRLSRQPPEALVATPATVDDAIRVSLLLGATVPLLDDEARSLRAELETLAALHREIATERLELEAATADLAAERARLEALHERKAALQEDTRQHREDAEARVARLAAEAKTLRDLLDRLAPAVAVPPPPPEPEAAPLPPVEKPATPEVASDGSVAVLALATPDSALDGALRSLSEARGELPMPARGRLVGLFGQLVNGVESKGISIETRPGAQVVTPYDGEVVFAGPFRGYGQLLIIEHGGGYHILLAGFSRIDSSLGQWLLAGEPVGVMRRGSNGNPVLYIELRQGGVAVNPLLWLAADEKKVSG